MINHNQETAIVCSGKGLNFWAGAFKILKNPVHFGQLYPGSAEFPYKDHSSCGRLFKFGVPGVRFGTSDPQINFDRDARPIFLGFEIWPNPIFLGWQTF